MDALIDFISRHPNLSRKESYQHCVFLMHFPGREIYWLLINSHLMSQEEAHLVAPPQLRARLITWDHTSPGTGHLGSQRTYNLLKDKYWWPKMSMEIAHYVTSCFTCDISKTPHTLPAGKLLPLPVPSQAWSHISINFITDLPSSQGHTVIMIIIDRFSKFLHLIPFYDLPMAFKTTELFHHVFPLLWDSQTHSSYISLGQDSVTPANLNAVSQHPHRPSNM